LSCPLRIIDSPWDPNSLTGGFELARQTNIALDACKYEICLYIQADEILHEDEYDLLRRDLNLFEKDSDIEALAFQWIHFYGNYETVVEARGWYRREIRAIRKSAGLRSFRDAQGFRIPVGEGWRKPKTALSLGHYRHYGWVRPPKEMAQKHSEFSTLWSKTGNPVVTHPAEIYPPVFGMKRYTGNHPKVMESRIQPLKEFDPFVGRKLRFHPKHFFYALSGFLETFFDWRPGEFRNYEQVKIYE